MFCFGISNHSPDQALSFLVARSTVSSVADIAIVPSGTRLKENKKPVRNVLFVVSISDFFHNLEVLNSSRYKNTTVFVFASPLRIRELENVIGLDFEPNPASIGIGFLLKKEINLQVYKRVLKLGEKHSSLKVVRKNAEFLTTITDNVKRGSLLNPLMTFLYTLPSSTHQTPVKEAVVQYIVKGSPFSKLEEKLDSIQGVVVSRRIRDRLKEILKSEIGDNYRAAFKAYRETKDDARTAAISSICKKFGTSDYEMKYLKSVSESLLASKAASGKTLAAMSKRE